MDPIEQAIRNAFAKGNPEDRAFREKVYRAAFSALDRALQANPSITVEIAIKRRKAMQAKIAEIESEYLPAVAGIGPQADADQPTPAVEPPLREAPPATARREPSLDDTERATPLSATREPHAASVAPDFVPEPTLAGSPDAEAVHAEGANEVLPDRDERRAARRRLPLGTLVVGMLLLAAVGGGLWWTATNGLLKLPERAATKATGTDTASSGAAGPMRPGEADKERDWISVFAPNDPTLVSAPSDASAEVMQDDSGSFLRIRSGASGAAVSFDVGQGILEELSGKHVVFDIVARSEEGKETPMALDCNFGDFGDCGRRRYAVGHERNEYLFDVQFPDKRPGSAGTIAINSDFDGQGRSVDIYEIRVSAAQ